MANERRLIDADTRIEEIKKAHCVGCDNYGGVKCRACWVDDAIGLIDDAPTVEAVEVVHGRWEKRGKHDWRCSVCKIGVPYSYTGHHYCPNCGAKMDGDGNG